MSIAISDWVKVNLHGLKGHANVTFPLHIRRKIFSGWVTNISITQQHQTISEVRRSNEIYSL